MFLVQAIYFILSFCVIYGYGSLINSSVLVNIGMAYPIKCATSSAL